MIQRPTVLILGAGASNPYGYPLGNQLLAQIASLISPAGGLYKMLKGETNPTLSQFLECIVKSRLDSIDDFLESNPKFADFGRFCLTAALTVWGPPHNHVPHPSGDWYTDLWRRLRERAPRVPDFPQNKLKVITFNYDHSFERIFAETLANAYHEELGTHVTAVTLQEEVIPVVHLHGSLRAAEEAVYALEDRTPFMRVECLKQWASGIRIVHEEQPSRELARAHEWLREARAVHFLGYGYHETSLWRLDLAKNATAAGDWELFGGTAQGLSDAAVRNLVNTISPTPSLHRTDCATYIREHALL